jgi:hypothetical protein
MLRPLTRGLATVALVCVLSPGSALAATGPQPDVPPPGLLGSPQPEAPPVTSTTRASSPPPKPARVARPSVAVAPAHSSASPPAARHDAPAPRRQPARSTAPKEPRQTPRVERRFVVPLPLAASLHPEEPASGGGSYALVALAAALLLLAGGSLAVTVAELRREPA